MNKFWIYKDVLKDSQSPMALTKSYLNRDYPLHKHDFCELVVILGGTGLHRINGSSQQVFPGMTYVIKPGDEHGYFENRNLELTNVIMYRRDMQDLLIDLKSLPGFQYLFVMDHENSSLNQTRYHKLSASELASARSLLEAMEVEYEQRVAGYQAKLKSIFLELSVLITRSFEDPQHNSDTAGSVRLGHGLAYMEKFFYKDISIPEVAEKANISLRQFQRLFSSLFGISPVQYLLNLRIQSACSHLVNTDAPVGEIGELCGFGDSNYFSRQFKRVTGLSPREFRREKKGLPTATRTAREIK